MDERREIGQNLHQVGVIQDLPDLPSELGGVDDQITKTQYHFGQ
ncbi:Uncharacterised protein [Mycobacteroides abscessus subsp. massiliense]|nr:Uncharacterised protein [Mycobacteroides abscessus subsp. massiliense]